MKNFPSVASKKIESAYEHFQPEIAFKLTHNTIPETDSINAISYTFAKTVLAVKNQNITAHNAHKLKDPWFPVEAETIVQDALYITCEVNETKHIDRSGKDRTTNIDALSALATLQNGKIILKMPEIPWFIKFSKEALEYYRSEILEKNNMHAMERFLEVVVRSVRKGKTFQREFSTETSIFIRTCMDKISRYWEHRNFPHNAVRHDYHNQELDAAAELDPIRTLNDIHELHIYRLMHTEVQNVFRSINHLFNSKVFTILLDERKHENFPLRALCRALERCVTPKNSKNYLTGVEILFVIFPKETRLYHLMIDRSRKLFQKHFKYPKRKKNNI